MATNEKAKNPNNRELQYTSKTTLGAKVYMPSISVSFHTKTKCYHAKGKAKNSYGELMNPNNTVLSITTNKTLESPAGTFTMNLEGNEWLSRLTPNDITVIEMGYVGEKKLTTVMVGLIDQISVKRSMGADGKPSVSTIVTGRDFGKLFVKDLLKFYPEINGVNKKSDSYFLTDVGWVNLMKVFTSDSIMKGSPAVLLDNIMRFIFSKIHDTKWTVYNEAGSKKQTISASQAIRYQLGKIDFFLPFIFTADQYEGALWNMMERASISPFTELFIDVRSYSEAYKKEEKGRVVPHTIEQASSKKKGALTKAKGKYPYPQFRFGQEGANVVLCLRETPYDTSLRKKLVTHTIKEVDVIDEDLSKSDNEHYNLFWAGTTVNALGIDLKRVCPPLFNESNAKRYGLSPLEVNIEGLEITTSGDKNKKKKTLEGLTKEYTKKLKAWYENNHKYLSGALVIRGNPKIRIGHRIKYKTPSFNKEFYVESVAQSFNVYEGWTTTISITRGMDINTKVDSSTKTKKKATKKETTTKKTTEKDSYHVVKRGDTLWALAGTYYGRNLSWRKIWDANKTMLIKRDKRNASDPGHWIYPGQKLRIPK